MSEHEVRANEHSALVAANRRRVAETSGAGR
jgi:hypothetical protein